MAFRFISNLLGNILSGPRLAWFGNINNTNTLKFQRKHRKKHLGMRKGLLPGDKSRHSHPGLSIGQGKNIPVEKLETFSVDLLADLCYSIYWLQQIWQPYHEKNESE
jgi:hypothetical protein